jgi:phosphatidylinositol-3-phosphatase
VKHARGWVLAAILATLLALSGCGMPDQTAPAPNRGVRPTPSASVPRHPGALDHVVIIVEENKPATTIIGNPDAPYLNALAAKFALAANYTAIMHPSLPNYLAMTSGSTGSISTDCNPRDAGCQMHEHSIVEEIEASGRTWKMYAENMPAPCSSVDYRKYAVKHNPFLYYLSVTSDPVYCAAHDVPFTQLARDLARRGGLPDYAFISPNLCNDMHNCPIATGDAWLSQRVPEILASPAFSRGNSLLVITWDEGSQSDNAVSTVFAGPAAKRGYRSQTAYDHYSLLHTIEKGWGLAPLTDNDRNAPTMDDLLR